MFTNSSLLFQFQNVIINIITENMGLLLNVVLNRFLRGFFAIIYLSNKCGIEYCEYRWPCDKLLMLQIKPSA